MLPLDAGALRVRLREAVPFAVRVAARRAPAVILHLRDRRRLARASAAGFPHLQCAATSPLRRRATTYAPDLQAAKEHNVARAAELLDGIVIPAGATFAWHREIGPPLRVRGFRPGPELHDGILARGGGGGACQVANLLFRLAVHAGLELVERHRHGLDLFPDDDRAVPFGCGATVFYPTRDLKLRNPHPFPVRLELGVAAGELRGNLRFPADVGLRFEIVEVWHRFVRRDGVVWRENRLDRRAHGPDGRFVDEILAEHRARVAYPVADVEDG